MYDHSLENAAYEWEMMKIAADEKKFKDRTMGELGTAAKRLAVKGTGYRDIKNLLEMNKAVRDARAGLAGKELESFNEMLKNKGYQESRSAADIAKGRTAARELGISSGMTPQQVADFRAARRGYGYRGGAKALGVLGAGTAAVMGARHLMKKKSSYDPMVAAVEELEGWEFAKEAELRAAEILLANGVDPETFEETYPEHVKLASFPDPEDAHTYEGEGMLEAYNEMLDEAALDIIEELGLI